MNHLLKRGNTPSVKEPMLVTPPGRRYVLRKVAFRLTLGGYYIERKTNSDMLVLLLIDCMIMHSVLTTLAHVS